MVRLSDGTALLPNATSLNQLNEYNGLIAMRPMSHKEGSAFRGFFEFDFPENADLQALKSTYETNSFVTWVSEIPNDDIPLSGPYFPPDPKFYTDTLKFLHMASDVADINAPEAWEWTLGSPNILIAVCGGGIAITPTRPQYAPDIASNIWTNPGETGMTAPGDRCWRGFPERKDTNHCDDDNNRYIDDIHGWNFTHNDNDIERRGGDIGHGTACAGYAAAAIDSSRTTFSWVGSAPRCKIMGVPAPGGNSIIYASENGAAVLSYSWGTGSYLAQFVTTAFQNGMIVSNGAGFFGGTVYDYPPYGVSVTALDSTNVPRGATGTNVRIAAPVSYIHTGGTSFAAPEVAGVVALMKSINPNLKVGQLRAILLDPSSVNPVNGTGAGVGRVDAFKAIKNASGTPELKNITGNLGEHPTLHWTPNQHLPSFDPNPTVEYIIQKQRDTDPDFLDIGTVNATITEYTDATEIIGRLPGGHYPTLYRVRARLTYGTGSILSVPSNTLSIFTYPGGEWGKVASSAPNETELIGNYPNPFNPTTKIMYTLAEESEVTLRVYDVLGREVASLVNAQPTKPGSHTVTFNASDLAGGVYHYRLQTDSYAATKRLVLLK